MNEDVLEHNEQEQQEKVAEESNQIKHTMYKKILYVAISSVILLFTRLYSRYADFDVIIRSRLFMILFVITIIISLIILVYTKYEKAIFHKQETKKKLKLLSDVFDVMSVIPIFMAIISLLNVVAVSPASVVGQSMEPTYFEEDDILIWHLYPDYERFDVVVIKIASQEYYIKRIIGMPGETVLIDNNEIYIDGNRIDQSFIDTNDVYTYCSPIQETICSFDIPEDSYFVLGDNREHSVDSRSSGVSYIKEDKIMGEVILKFHNIFN